MATRCEVSVWMSDLVPGVSHIHTYGDMYIYMVVCARSCTVQVTIVSNATMNELT